jgi:hypothetical protein
MNLDDLIAQMTNPQEFTRLCNSIFTDIYGHDFQVIDGTRGDDGNDGYVASERRMLAMYCPIKPEQKTDAGYVEKIRSDINKAAALKHSNRYEIEIWTFITPRKLANSVIVAMREFAKEAGFRASHQESTFLANEFYRRSHLLKGFPGLQQIDLSAKIDDLASTLRAREGLHIDGAAVSPTYSLGASDTAGHARFNQIIEGNPTREAKSELKAMAYQIADPILEINVVLALFRWFDPSDDDRAELLVFADRGIEQAKRIGNTDAEALFRAQKSAFFLLDFNTQVIESHFAGALDFMLPFATTPIEQSQQRLTRIRRLEEGWRGETAAAIELIKGSRDYEAVGNVLVVMGTNMGQLALTARQLGKTDEANQYITKSKTLFLSAKGAYQTAGDELGAANAVFNLANQIRWHDGKNEALILVKQTIPLAEKHGDTLLLQKARWLQHTLETGNIPDYLAGQRRAWSTDPPDK